MGRQNTAPESVAAFRNSPLLIKKFPNLSPFKLIPGNATATSNGRHAALPL
jgi:hypothetical protein